MSASSFSIGPYVACGLDQVRHEQLLRNIRNGAIVFSDGCALPDIKVVSLEWNIYPLAVIKLVSGGCAHHAISQENLYARTREYRMEPCPAHDLFSLLSTRLLPIVRPGRYVWASEPFLVAGVRSLYTFVRSEDDVVVSSAAVDETLFTKEPIAWMFRYHV